MTTSTTATRKPTQRDRFAEIREILVSVGRDDLVEFVDGRVAQLDKKNTAERKPTARQNENEGFKADILAWFEPDTLYCAADVVKGVPSIVGAGLSVNRVSPMLKALAEEGKLTCTVDKRKNFYSLA